ncbi:MAG: hypothetical protein A2481_04600 [Candidatus Yonathbacteria bacterium RIFOXYC2_FULL_47_9]|nr:MAG: hypothetical protein A2481_04600 [Candidatus Yonathbacteria bacterium RIFOXYC2_FULL_47_9]HAT68663.1 hypothetical protein [Candidatus Yonathbacteria bacterium]
MAKVIVIFKKRRGSTASENTALDPMLAIRKNAEEGSPVSLMQTNIRRTGHNTQKHKRLML